MNNLSVEQIVYEASKDVDDEHESRIRIISVDPVDLIVEHRLIKFNKHSCGWRAADDTYAYQVLAKAYLDLIVVPSDDS